MKRYLKGLKSSRRKAIDTEKDPYLSDTVPPDGTVCAVCLALWHDKHWSLTAGVATESLGGAKKSANVLCPACKKVRDDFAEGYVEISGDFAVRHMDEIMKILLAKEARAMRINPLERIIGMRKGKKSLEVRTTTEKLAQRLGRMLGKTLNGNVAYKWSKDTKVARVSWTREA